MFSGIIETTCPVTAVHDGPGSRRLALDLGALAGPPPGLGDSIAVNGVCLTVAGSRGGRFDFDVVTETLERTNLGDLQAGALVNVERALAYGQRVDGHLVQGHVEGTGEVLSVETQAGQTWFTLRCGADFAARCLPKGSVALDGVSLTVAELGADRLAVALVPHTLSRTTLGARRPGDRINLEPDMLGQWVLAHLARSRGSG